MEKKTLVLLFVLIIAILAACGNGTDNERTQEMEEPKTLEVEFEVPENADAGGTVELKAIVTYGDEKVVDADEVKFEYWKKGNEDDSTMIESNNNKDGTYTAAVSFDSDGIYEMYAHTTARDLHTMPKKSIVVGEGASTDEEEVHPDYSEKQGHSENADGFGMHFVKPEDAKVNQGIDLIVHLQMESEPFGGANVRYEIFHNSNSEKHDWVDAEESETGEYSGSYTFSEAGVYTIRIHVENDAGLHEHKEYEVDVSK